MNINDFKESTTVDYGKIIARSNIDVLRYVACHADMTAECIFSGAFAAKSFYNIDIDVNDMLIRMPVDSLKKMRFYLERLAHEMVVSGLICRYAVDHDKGTVVITLQNGIGLRGKITVRLCINDFNGETKNKLIDGRYFRCVPRETLASDLIMREFETGNASYVNAVVELIQKSGFSYEDFLNVAGVAVNANGVIPVLDVIASARLRWDLHRYENPEAIFQEYCHLLDVIAYNKPFSNDEITEAYPLLRDKDCNILEMCSALATEDTLLFGPLALQLHGYAGTGRSRADLYTSNYREIVQDSILLTEHVVPDGISITASKPTPFNEHLMLPEVESVFIMAIRDKTMWNCGAMQKALLEYVKSASDLKKLYAAANDFDMPAFEVCDAVEQVLSEASILELFDV